MYRMICLLCIFNRGSLLFYLNKDIYLIGIIQLSKSFLKLSAWFLTYGMWYDVAQFKQEILRNPNVKSASMGAPIENYGENAEFGKGSIACWTNVEGQEDSLRMVLLYADGDFVKTFKMELLKGELMDADFGNYWKNAKQPSIVINEAAWHHFIDGYRADVAESLAKSGEVVTI